MYQVQWDGLTQRQIDLWANQADQELAGAIYNTMQDAGEAATNFIRPMLKGNNLWQPSTGKLAASLRYEMKVSGDEYTVQFFADAQTEDGRYYQGWMDEGNFPPTAYLYAYNYTSRATGRPLSGFPISQRVGNVTQYLGAIRGMGATSSDSPRHFSTKAQAHMTEEIHKIADKQMQAFLNRVVISK